MRPTILTVTPNPAIDKTAVVPGFQLGKIHRPQELLMLAGGKGINVARSIHRLGGTCRVCLLLGGHAGRWVLDQLALEEIPAEAAWFDGETRTCLSILDPQSGQLTELYETGKSVGEATWMEFATLVGHQAAEMNWVILSGSLPPGAPPNGYANLIHTIQTISPHARIFLDTGGKNLSDAVLLKSFLVKINQSEAAELIGEAIETLDEVAQAAQKIRRRGAQAVVITCGPIGAVGVDASGHPFAWRAPRVAAISAVGSGDAFLAGITIGLDGGLDLRQAAQLGVAAGAANTLSLGAGCFEKEQVERLLAEVASVSF